MRKQGRLSPDHWVGVTDLVQGEPAAIHRRSVTDTDGKIGAQVKLHVDDKWGEVTHLLSKNPQHVNVTLEFDWTERKRNRSYYWIPTLLKMNVNSNPTR